MKSWPAEVAEADAPEPRLDDRVRELLGTNGGRLAFNGLRRALGVHPESLTRALKRLEREGVVQRRADGYVLADPGSYAAEPHLTPPTHTIALVQLPTGISHEAVLGHLAGRWFGTLRWVGVYDRPGDPWLVWSVGSTSDRVMLSIRRGSLKVLVEGDPKDPLRPEVETASWDLLRHALDRLRPTQRPDDDSLATFGRDYIPDGGWFGFAG